ncbi:MAG: hypothetical protein KC493_09105 [Bacteriovoracaceae bacterium]|nr:hypothetical protein [Bacteriovoracaceae bacterium]
MVIKNLLVSIILVLLVSSCSSGGRKSRQKLRTQFKTGKFKDALKTIQKSKYYQEKNETLLKLMELGMIHHAAGNYYQSVMVLNKASSLVKKLYTQRLSQKMKKVIANDNYDIFYGASYERSLIHFYLALNHYLIWQRGWYEAYSPDPKKQIPQKNLTPSERNTEILAARAEIVAWDSFLSTLKNEKLGESVFKNDMMAKTFGGLIHEAIGLRDDQQIALQLYKDAKDLLLKNYNGYKTFNKKFKKFKKDFKKLPKMKLSDVKAKYVAPTSYQKSLEDFLNYKILSLTKQIRPRDFKKLVKIYSPSKEILKQVKKNKKQHNVSLVLQEGMIPKKIGDKKYFGLGKALNDPKSGAAARIGAAVLTVFAANKLGLLPPPGSYNPSGSYVGIKMGEATVAGAAISFELPKVLNKPVRNHVKLEIYNPAGKLVDTRPVALINPLGDIAEEAISEEASSAYLRVGSRLALKHAAAIAASFATYKAMKGGNRGNDFLAKNAAVLQYLGVSKGIEASEKADTRFWSTLPGNLRLSSFYLPKGDYLFKLRVTHGAKAPPGSGRLISLGPVKIEKEDQVKLINFRTFQ